MINNLQFLPALVPRTKLLQCIEQELAQCPVVAVLGARQVGKTTLARRIASQTSEPPTLFELESHTTRKALSEAPEFVLRNSTGLVIIDNVQRHPELLAILKRICENPNRQAQFLLFSSTSPDLTQGVSESLSRTVRFIDMCGFSLDEIGFNNQNRLWFRGGLPRSYLSKDDDAARRWLNSFVRSYLERDVLSIDPRATPVLVERFIGMLARHHGYTWNASQIGDSLGIRDRAVNRFRDILSNSLMIRCLPAWSDNLGKRLIKSPKIYLRDSGILHFLLGLTSFSELAIHPCFLSSWEGFALEQTLVAHGSHESYFYRTQRGTELDLLLLRNDKRWGFEFKCSDAPRTSKSMHIAIKDLNLEHLWVIYPGTKSFPLTESITTLPLGQVSSLVF